MPRKAAPVLAPIDDSAVVAILRGCLGDDAPLDLIPVALIAGTLRRAKNSSEFPPAGGWSVSDEYRKFHDAVTALHALLPGMVADADFEPAISNLSRLKAAVDEVAPDLHDFPRRADVRSAWHPTACILASLIEGGYEKAGISAPSRITQTSPLVSAIKNLLAQLGLDYPTDTIRKALDTRDAAQELQQALQAGAEAGCVDPIAAGLPVEIRLTASGKSVVVKIPGRRH